MPRTQKVSGAELAALVGVLDDKTSELQDLGRRASEKGVERPATDRELSDLLLCQSALAALVATLMARRAMDEHMRETEARIRADLHASGQPRP